MRILAISDKIVPALYSPALGNAVGSVDLILSCGDLPAYYIDYIASTLGVPCYLVHGNHASGAEFEEVNPFEPRRVHYMDIDNRVVIDKELFLAGLEGSIRYNSNPASSTRKTRCGSRSCGWRLRLLWNRLFHGRWLDILVAHSPPAGIHDGPDRPHLGFDSFLWLMRTFKPRYLVARPQARLSSRRGDRDAVS